MVVLLLVIQFHLGYFSTKLDILTKQWNIYPKRRDTGYFMINIHNFKSIFTHKQFATLL